MKDETVYAVVDIETTGTDQHKDKIIQFACVFVQDRKIINYFSSDINPLQAIPKNITKLTGISNKQVAKAPYFEDIAPTIIDLLSGCVFVAHNVYFDYSFLNSELQRAHFPELNVPCVDTVELAQILFPSAPGFRVTDLAEYLSLNHDSPHQAISDAYVTAEILIEILNKIDQIPLVTLHKMTDLSTGLGVDNKLIFKKATVAKENDSDYQALSDLKTIEMISLRVKKDTFKDVLEKKQHPYPYGNLKKELENNSYHFNDTQSKMMDTIYQFATDVKGAKNLMIESVTGSGKTLGYLFPVSFLVSKKKPIVLSTSTILLQNQLATSSLPFLEKVTRQSIVSVVLKSSRHFIDLEKFYRTLVLKPNNQKQYVINQMAILSWLMETETGDLDELSINKNSLLFDQIKHDGRKTVSGDSLFANEDFVIYLEEKKKKADVIIVNHAFLCEESFREPMLLPKSDVLIIDEAHKLVQEIENCALHFISFKDFFHLLKGIENAEERLANCETPQQKKQSEIMVQIKVFSQNLKEDLKLLEHFFVEYGNLSGTSDEILLDEYGKLQEWPLAIQKTVKSVLIIIDEINQLITHFLSTISDTEMSNVAQSYFPFCHYVDLLKKLSSLSLKLVTFFNEDQTNETKWVRFKKEQLTLCGIDFQQVDIEQTSWYPRFKKIIFTSGTLQLDVSTHYFENQLNLPQPMKIKFEETFSYDEKAKLLIVKDSKTHDFTTIKHYVDYLAQAILACYQMKKGSILVLFTSHQMIKAVFHRIKNLVGDKQIDLFAQGITGTKEKMMKRFKKSPSGIILGANSFWEGVDINIPQLNLVIMVKLPFDPPNRPMIEAKYRYIESKGRNAFYDEAIPQAGSRLRQGIGRLLRTDSDKGMILVLDDRLLRSSYSERLLAYLPKQIPMEEVTLKEALSEINRFFDEKKEED